MKPFQMRVQCDQCGNWHDVENITVESGLFGFEPIVVHIYFECPAYPDTKFGVLDVLFGNSESVHPVEENLQVKHRTSD